MRILSFIRPKGVKYKLHHCVPNLLVNKITYSLLCKWIGWWLFCLTFRAFTSWRVTLYKGSHFDEHFHRFTAPRLTSIQARTPLIFHEAILKFQSFPLDASWNSCPLNLEAAAGFSHTSTAAFSWGFSRLSSLLAVLTRFEALKGSLTNRACAIDFRDQRKQMSDDHMASFFSLRPLFFFWIKNALRI